MEKKLCKILKRKLDLGIGVGIGAAGNELERESLNKIKRIRLMNETELIFISIQDSTILKFENLPKFTRLKHLEKILKETDFVDITLPKMDKKTGLLFAFATFSDQNSTKYALDLIKGQ